MINAIIPVLKRNIGVISCLILSVILLVFIHSRMEDLPELNNQYEQSARTLDVMMKNQAQGSELGAQLAELERLTAGLDSRVMKSDDKAINADFFYAIEKRSHAKIVALKQLSSSQTGDARQSLTQFTATAFELSISGRIGYAMSFLKRLENAKYFVRCNDVSIKGDPVLAPDAVDITIKLEVLSKKI
jgi:hypothetical protein